MSASANCPHPDLEYVITTMLAADNGQAYMRVTAARCRFCDRRWRFVGVSTDKDLHAPTANRAMTEMVVPMIEVSR